MLTSSDAPQGRPVAPEDAERDAARLSAQRHAADPVPAAAGPSRRSTRRAALGALLAAVALLHAVLLDGVAVLAPRLAARPTGRTARPAAAMVAVRLLDAALPAASESAAADATTVDASAEATAVANANAAIGATAAPGTAGTGAAPVVSPGAAVRKPSVEAAGPFTTQARPMTSRRVAAGRPAPDAGPADVAAPAPGAIAASATVASTVPVVATTAAAASPRPAGTDADADNNDDGGAPAVPRRPHRTIRRVANDAMRAGNRPDDVALAAPAAGAAGAVDAAEPPTDPGRVPRRRRSAARQGTSAAAPDGVPADDVPVPGAVHAAVPPAVLPPVPPAARMPIVDAAATTVRVALVGDADAGDAMPAAPRVAAAVAAPPRADAVPGAADSVDVPVYRTRLPPAFALAYVLRRGVLSGTGELVWQPDATRYDLRLEGRVAGIRLLALESRGTLDADGVAPVRYTDTRRGRGTQAANFQRLVGGGGKITYSGPSTEAALPRGAQDRVTWLVQLAAIAAADPARIGPGGQVSMLVSGARADVDVWTFVHAGRETLDIGGVPTPTVRLLRAARYDHDTRVDVWLDPARRWLPVRARLSNPSGDDAGEAFELMLRG